MYLDFDGPNRPISHDLILYRFAPRFLLLVDSVFEDKVHLLQRSALCLGNE